MAEAGADAEFVALFVDQRAGALRLAALLLGDADLAGDVVADAFARMYPHWRQGQVDDPTAYLRKAVVNGVRGRWRRRRTAPHVEALRDDDGIPVVDLATAASDRLAVRGALLSLPPRMRAAVVLRYLDDLSEAETAAALGTSVGTVKGYVARGLVRLRAALDDDESDR